MSAQVELTPVQVVNGLIVLERVRARVLADAAGRPALGDGPAAMARSFARGSEDRAAALRTQLEALGGGLAGPKPLDPYEDPLAGARTSRELLRALARLERVAVDTYARALGRLDVPEVAATAASAMAAHAQQLVALRLALGETGV